MKTERNFIKHHSKKKIKKYLPVKRPSENLSALSDGLFKK
jgi:hypothetical protein